MAEILVTMQDVARSFTVHGITVDALLPVTCTLRAGDRIAISGPSGSGKSTFLNLAAGLDRPTSGSITWPVFDATRLRPGSIATVFQMSSLIPALTALDNVALPLRIMGETTDIETRARNALARFGLEALALRFPTEMSGGQIQRAAIARAIVKKPKLILADEPTGQLDSATAALTMESLLAAANETGAALVIATHDSAIAARLTVNWFMDYGKLTQTKLGIAA